MGMNRVSNSNNNTYDLAKMKTANAKAAAGAAGAVAGAAAGAAAGVKGGAKASKNEDILKLSAVAGQASDAPQVNLDSSQALPKVAHTAALISAAALLPPGLREASVIALMSEKLVDKMFEQFQQTKKAE